MRKQGAPAQTHYRLSSPCSPMGEVVHIVIGRLCTIQIVTGRTRLLIVVEALEREANSKYALFIIQFPCRTPEMRRYTGRSSYQTKREFSDRAATIRMILHFEVSAGERERPPRARGRVTHSGGAHGGMRPHAHRKFHNENSRAAAALKRCPRLDLLQNPFVEFNDPAIEIRTPTSATRNGAPTPTTAVCACAQRATPASAETEAEYLGESVSNFDMTTFARSRYRDFAESRSSKRAPPRARAHPARCSAGPRPRVADSGASEKLC
ncbi:hypothetical protein EVAR_22879_1 [Eumeta japonica]|uniref:Uncharacterized protein n=1 Tax=Eumeta variegata TaxID=151549 RepID=A0A4C1UUK6_EUMVA|nr:hypothetical protein EVAR_22879_1 [Eumeta japonica]